MAREKFVVLLRHGIAYPRGSMPEKTRGLTEAGHRRMKEIARSLVRLLPEVDAIYSSPLLRCRQTAEHVAEHYDVKITEIDELLPDAEPKKFERFIRASDGQRLICVGHEPTLTAMMLQITGMSGELELKKGGSYAVRLEPRGGALEWMLPPSVLR